VVRRKSCFRSSPNAAAAPKNRSFGPARRSDVNCELGLSNWALLELIEAAAHMGQRDTAAHAFHEPREMTRASDTDWALGVETRMNALLNDGDEADGLYRESISQLEPSLSQRTNAWPLSLGSRRATPR
jgi:hypothetical protein